MGICWYCYWGWPKPVTDIYDAAVTELNGDDLSLRFGPSHIVWEDENFADNNIRYCLDLCEKGRMKEEDTTLETLVVVRRSLEQLLAIPENIRCCCPEEYDGDDPEKYPPPVGVEMVKR